MAFKVKKRQIDLFVISSIAGLGLILIGFVLWKQYSEQGFRTYRSQGFQLKYPATWSVSENLDGVAVLFSSPLENDLDFFKENVNIVVQPVPKELKRFEQYNDLALRQMRAVFENNMVIIENRDLIWNGNQGHKLVYIGKSPESDLKLMHYWTIEKGLAYQFTYTALATKFDEYIEKVNVMVKSFRLR